MKLQLALDFTSIGEAEKILDKINDLIDIVEIGTPFIIREGLKVVEKIKKLYPCLPILADLKIMDAGGYEAEMAFRTGADIITVLGVSDNATIVACVEQAKHFKRQVMVDMIGSNDIKTRVSEVNGLGVDYICVHTAFDVKNDRNSQSIDYLKLAKDVVNKSKLAVAGGINLSIIKEIIAESPEIIIVGGGITSQPDIRETASRIKDFLKGH